MKLNIAKVQHGPASINYVRAFSNEEIADLIQDHDYENVQQMLQDEPEQQKKVTAKIMYAQATDKKNLQTYERARNLCNKELASRSRIRSYLRKNHPDQQMDGGDDRFGDAFIDPGATMQENYNNLRSADSHTEQVPDPKHPGKTITKTIRDRRTDQIAKNFRKAAEAIQNTDFNQVLSLDSEDMVDGLENSPNAMAVLFTGQLDTILSDARKHRVRELPNGELPMDTMKDFSLEASPEGMDPELASFIMEIAPLAGLISANTGRVFSYANPKLRMIPNDLDLHTSIYEGAVAHPPQSAQGMYGNDQTAYDGIRPYSYDPFFYSSMVDSNIKDVPYDQMTANQMNYVIMTDKDIRDKGYLQPDFSAYKKGPNGEDIRLNKVVALKMYKSDPSSVEFRLNEYGKKMQPQRDELRMRRMNMELDFHKMRAPEGSNEKRFYDNGNASPEFVALNESVKDFNNIWEEEGDHFIPNMDKIARRMATMKEAAQAYMTAKAGQHINTLRGQRLEWARQIMTMEMPMVDKIVTKQVDENLRSQQIEMRSLIDEVENGTVSMEAQKPKIENCLAAMMVHQTFQKVIAAKGNEMSDAELLKMTDPKEIDRAVTSMRNSAAFKAVINHMEPLTTEKLEEFASDELGIITVHEPVNHLQKALVNQTAQLARKNIEANKKDIAAEKGHNKAKEAADASIKRSSLEKVPTVPKVKEL